MFAAMYIPTHPRALSASHALQHLLLVDILMILNVHLKNIRYWIWVKWWSGELQGLTEGLRSTGWRASWGPPRKGGGCCRQGSSGLRLAKRAVRNFQPNPTQKSITCLRTQRHTGDERMDHSWLPAFNNWMLSDSPWFFLSPFLFSASISFWTFFLINVGPQIRYEMCCFLRHKLNSSFSWSHTPLIVQFSKTRSSMMIASLLSKCC